MKEVDSQNPRHNQVIAGFWSDRLKWRPRIAGMAASDEILGRTDGEGRIWPSEATRWLTSRKACYDFA